MNDVPITDWMDGNWMDAIVQTWTGSIGDPLFGAIIGTGILVSLYVYSDDMALPTIVLILFASSLFATLPGDVQQTAYGVLAIGIMAAIFEISRRYFT